MKKLAHEEHAPVNKEPVHGVTRRRFFKLGAASAMAAALMFGGLSPTMAKANNTTTIEGRELTIVALDRTLAELDQSSAQYRGRERFETRSLPYTNDAAVPNEARFLVTLDHNDSMRRNYRKTLAVVYPRERDRDPDREGAGMAGFNLTDFSNYIRQISGVEMRRVKFYVETGTFEYNGRQTTYSTAYIMPLDANGNLINRRNAPAREYIAYVSNYYADYVDGGVSLLQEPRPGGPVARR